MKPRQYGDKRDYPKIDIYVSGQYVCSTTWAKAGSRPIPQAAVRVRIKNPTPWRWQRSAKRVCRLKA